MREADYRQERRGGWTPEEEAEAAGERALELQREIAELECSRIDQLADEIRDSDFPDSRMAASAHEHRGREPGEPSVTGPGRHL